MTVFQTVSSSSHLQTQIVTLTSTQVKNLSTAPITIVPPPVGGNVIIPHFISLELVYGGNNAFTATGDMRVSYYDGVSAYFIGAFPNLAAFITSTSNVYNLGNPLVPTTLFTPAQCENLPVVLESIGAGDFGGNAANDNSVIVHLQYTISF